MTPPKGKCWAVPFSITFSEIYAPESLHPLLVDSFKVWGQCVYEQPWDFDADSALKLKTIL